MLRGHLERRPDHAARGVRDDEVESPEALDGGVDDPVDVVGVAEMPLHEQGAAPLRLDEPLRLVRGILVADVADGDVGALARELQARRPADARARRR